MSSKESFENQLFIQFLLCIDCPRDSLTNQRFIQPTFYPVPAVDRLFKRFFNKAHSAKASTSANKGTERVEVLLRFLGSKVKQCLRKIQTSIYQLFKRSKILIVITFKSAATFCSIFAFKDNLPHPLMLSIGTRAVCTNELTFKKPNPIPIRSSPGYPLSGKL